MLGVLRIGLFNSNDTVDNHISVFRLIDDYIVKF